MEDGYDSTASEECEWQLEDTKVGSGKFCSTRGQSNPEQVAAKPNTPPGLPSEHAKPRHVKPTVINVSSDSSDSEFHVSLESPESNDYKSSKATKRKSNSHERVDIDLNESFVDVDVHEYDQPLPRGRQRKQPRAPARANNRKIREKVAKFRQPRQPVPLLAWELLQEEWDDEWTNCLEDYSKPEEEPAKSVKLEQRDPPTEMIMPLLPFQKEWLAWSLKQEAGTVKGGILADEMGMGKTIEAIALIITGRALNRPPPSELDLGPSFGASCSTSPASHIGHIHSDDSLPKLPQVKATLVICPLVAIIQWRNEVARFTRSGSVKVLVYHGPRRSIRLRQLEEYDIILTTYSIVESEHRKHVMPPKDACKWCRRRFYPDRMILHQRRFCGPFAQKTAKQALQEKRRPESGKIVIEGAEEDGMEGLVDFLIDHEKKSRKERASVAKGNCKGKGKATSVDGKGKLGKPPVTGGGRARKRKIGEVELKDALQGATEVVRTLEKAGSSEAANGNAILHSVRWERIILDEAHSIKDRKCSTAKAVFALQSEYKWALSGTPLQNRIGELYSLVRFLGMYPYAYYFCRKCECKSLDYKQKFGLQAMKCDCGHTPMVHFYWWNKYIEPPISRDGCGYQGGRSMVLLKKKVLANALLRRTKLERAADLALPPRTAFLRRDAFDSKEEDFYQALYTQSQSQFNTYVTAGTLVNNYAHIFDLLTRLRQAVDHPYLVVYSATTCREAPIFDIATVNAATVEGSCGICLEPAEESVITACRHTFCRSCIEEYIAAAAGSTSQCPSCSVPLTVDLAGPKTAAPEVAGNGYKRTSILSRIDLQQFKSSTKIDAVREEIALMLDRDAGAKAIIFSQFNSMLDLIGFSLQRSGIKFVKLDGSMTMAARDVMIESFKNDADTKVFLMSLKAGGVALNLTVASHVFLMDPWWNPAVEQQAQDRIHRLGQFKPIRVIRFVIENTIEERILKLQEKKQLVFEGTVGGSSEALGKLTEEDLRFLFTN